MEISTTQLRQKTKARGQAPKRKNKKGAEAKKYIGPDESGFNSFFFSSVTRALHAINWEVVYACQLA